MADCERSPAVSSVADILCLPGIPPHYTGDEVFCGVVTITRHLVLAGRAAFERFEAKPASAKGCRKDGRESTEDEDEDGGEAPEEDRRWGNKHNQKQKSQAGAPSRLKRLLEGPNLYEVLRVNESASFDEIRKAYRRMALAYHPDKKKLASIGSSGSSSLSSPGRAVAEGKRLSDQNKSPSATASNTTAKSQSPSLKSTPSLTSLLSSSEASAVVGGSQWGLTDDELFLLVQDAYEILADSDMRRQYDSALPFDESIPSPDDVKGDDPSSFYRVFGPVFVRNARWSSKSAVPPLGNAETKMKDVNRFYNFWNGFETVRDFSINDEYDLGDAECREEKRWMERQNAKTRRKYIKEEKARIGKLVEIAYSLDPRIREEKDEQRRRKEAVKEEKRRLAEAKREELRLGEEQRRKEEQRIAEEKLKQQQQQSEARQLAKADVKKYRQKLRHLFSPLTANGEVEAHELQEICLGYGTANLRQLCEEVETRIELKASSQELGQIVQVHLELLSRQRREEEKSKREQAELAKNARQKEEHDRKKGLQHLAPWTSEESSTLAKGLQKYPPGTANRWRRLADFIGTKTEIQVLEKAKQLADGSSLKSVGAKSGQAAFDQFVKDNTGALKAIEVAPDRRLDGDVSGKPSLVDTDETSLGRPTVSSSGKIASSEAGVKLEYTKAADSTKMVSNKEWSAEEQTRLEDALILHTASMPPKDRWICIGNYVGRPPRECLARFKDIRKALAPSAG